MANQDFASLDPAEYTIAIGSVPIGGFMPGTFLEVARVSETFTDVVGADGLVTRVRSKDKRGTVTITLQQTSASNLIFSALHTADERAKNGAGVVPVFIRDKQGTTIFEGARAWVTKPADAAVGSEVQPRVWIIRVAALNGVIGGN
jgi:hypothetical protein